MEKVGNMTCLECGHLFHKSHRQSYTILSRRDLVVEVGEVGCNSPLYHIKDLESLDLTLQSMKEPLETLKNLNSLH